MNHGDFQTQMKATLQQTLSLRMRARENPAIGVMRQQLRLWQARRLATTHDDLLHEPRYQLAARFFLDELYGEADFSDRDDEVEKIIPLMCRVLPERALTSIQAALALEALSEQLDAEMVHWLLAKQVEVLTERDYVVAYQQCGSIALRSQQIAYIQHIGEKLDQLVRVPMMQNTLRMMATPAKLAGLAQLHTFLTAGFKAFKHMGGAEEFLRRIITRETAQMQAWFADSK